MTTREGIPAAERVQTAFTPQFDLPPATGKDDLARYLDAMRRHLRLVVLVPIVLALIAGGASLLRRREYAAHAAFLSTEPSSPSGSLGSLGAIASQLGIPALSAIANGSATLGPQFYGDLLMSNALVHSLLLTRFDASAPGEYGGAPFTGTLLEYYKPSAKTETDREIYAMQKFVKNNLTVSVDRPTGVVRFNVKTKNRLLSALVARRMLELVNDFNLRRRQTQAGNERDFAARRSVAAADSLRSAEHALAEFRASNIDFSRSPRLAERENELQRRITLAQQIYTTVAQRYETANLEAVRNTPVITVLDPPEGLVESLPRHTVAIAIGAFLLGLIGATLYAINLESRRSHEVRI